MPRAEARGGSAFAKGFGGQVSLRQRLRLDRSAFAKGFGAVVLGFAPDAPPCGRGASVLTFGPDWGSLCNPGERLILQRIGLGFQFDVIEELKMGFA